MDWQAQGDRGAILLESSHNGNASEILETIYVATFMFRQTGTELSVFAQTELSSSNGISGSVLVGDSSGIKSEYRNEPAAGSLDTMRAHYGAAWSVLENDGRRLPSQYYSHVSQMEHEFPGPCSGCLVSLQQFRKRFRTRGRSNPMGERCREAFRVGLTDRAFPPVFITVPRIRPSSAARTVP